MGIMMNDAKGCPKGSPFLHIGRYNGGAFCDKTKKILNNLYRSLTYGVICTIIFSDRKSVNKNRTTDNIIILTENYIGKLNRGIIMSVADRACTVVFAAAFFYCRKTAE